MPIDLASLLLRRRAAALAAVLLALPAPAADGTADGDVDAALGRTDRAIVTLDLGPDAQLPTTIALELRGELVTVDLEPHSVRGLGFQVLEDRGREGLVPIEVGPARTLRGEVREMPGSVVAGALTRDGLKAVLALPDVDGRYWIEPAPGAGAGAHVVYHDLDRPDLGGVCGVADDEAAAPLGGPGAFADPLDGVGGVAGGGGEDCIWTVELGIDTDFPFYQDFDEDSLAVVGHIESVISTMNVQYERDVQITHEIVTIILRTSPQADPYSSQTSPSLLLGEFRGHWNSVLSSVPRDVAQLFTGRDLAGSVIGIAYLGGICNHLGYSVVQNFGTFPCQTDLSAHELGHNWSANHCGCPTNTMNSSLTCSNEFHPSSTVPEIILFRNSIAGCLDNSCGLTNDMCATAAPVAAGAYPFDTTLAFTDGPSESSCPPGTPLTPIDSDIWYRYVSPCNGTVAVSVCDAAFDTRLAVYENFCPVVANQKIACSDDACGEQSSLSFEAEDGVAYIIRVGGRDGATGPGTLVIDDDACESPVVNDDCGDSMTIIQGEIPFTTNGATTDGPSEDVCDADIERDVWFRFQAPCDTTAQVRTCDADFDTRVAIYEGACPNGLPAAVACASDGCGEQAEVTFPVEAGAIYRIRVGGAEGETGDGVLQLVCGEPLCPADVDGNGTVDVDDLITVILEWGTDAASADVDDSGLVDVDDLIAVLLAWGACGR